MKILFYSCGSDLQLRNEKIDITFSTGTENGIVDHNVYEFILVPLLLEIITLFKLNA